MGDSSSALIGDMIVEAGLATREQVDECVVIQRSRQAESGTLQLLGQIMVERGYVSAEQLVVVLQGDPSPRTNRFGDLCVRMGFLTEAEVQEAVSEQRRLRRRGTERRLGDILVDKHRLSDPQLQAVLGAQGLEVAQCSRCRVECNIGSGAGAGAHACEHCGGELVIVTSFDEDVLVEGDDESPDMVFPDPVADVSSPPPALVPAPPEPEPLRAPPAAVDDDETTALKEKLAKLEDALHRAERDAEDKVNTLRAQLDVADGIRAVATEERDEVLSRLDAAERLLEDARVAQEQGVASEESSPEDMARLKAELEEREAKLEAERIESERKIVAAEQAREEAETVARSAKARLQASDEARAGAAAARDEALSKLTEVQQKLLSPVPGSVPVALPAAAAPAIGAGGPGPELRGRQALPVPGARWPVGSVPPPPPRRPPPVRATPNRPLASVTRPTGILRRRRGRRVVRVVLALLGIAVAAAFVLGVFAWHAPHLAPGPVVGLLEATGILPGGISGRPDAGGSEGREQAEANGATSPDDASAASQ